MKINVVTPQDAIELIEFSTGINIHKFNWVHRPEQASACFDVNGEPAKIIVYKMGLKGLVDIILPGRGISINIIDRKDHELYNI